MIDWPVMQSSYLFHSMQFFTFRTLSLALFIYLSISVYHFLFLYLAPYLSLSWICPVSFHCPSSVRFVLVCLCPVYILSLSLYSLLVSLSYLLYPVPVFAQCQFILFYFCPVSVLSYPASSLSVLFFLVYILSILSLYCF